MACRGRGLVSVKEAALVLLSGGIDSMACAHFLLRQDFAVGALHIDYGQLARRFEAQAASSVAANLNIPVSVVSLHLPLIHTIGEVRGRNGLFAMAALAASEQKTSVIATGIHSGTTYYDCSPPFVERMDAVIQEYTSGHTRYFCPFLNWSKSDIYDYCVQHRLNIQLTYSCESGTDPVCGICASCRDRRLVDVR